MKISKKTTEHFLETTLFSHHKDLSNAIEQIHNFVHLAVQPVRLALINSEKNLFSLIKERNSSEFKIDVEFSNKEVLVATIERTFGRKKKKKVSGTVLFLKHPSTNAYLVVTKIDTSFWHDGILNLLYKIYPDVVFPFFYSWEMETMLDVLSKNNPDKKINLIKISRKSRLKGLSSRKSKESDLTWTDLPYKEVFSTTRDNDQWVEKVSFDLLKEIKISDVRSRTDKVMSGSFSRNGCFKIDEDFKGFFNSILTKGIALMTKRLGNLSHRERSKSANFASKPVYIEFSEPVFRDKEQNRRLVNALKMLSNSANSVIHQNPYMHVVLMDYLDNSNMDIWVLSDTRITISPQTVCTMSSLNRLCDHISKEFKEGEIKVEID